MKKLESEESITVSEFKVNYESTKEVNDVKNQIDDQEIAPIRRQQNSSKF